MEPLLIELLFSKLLLPIIQAVVWAALKQLFPESWSNLQWHTEHNAFLMFLSSTPTFFNPFRSLMPFYCLFPPSSLFTTSAASFISLPLLCLLLSSCRNLTGMASLSFWGIDMIFFKKSAAYLFFNTFFFTIYSMSSSGQCVVPVRVNYLLQYSPFLNIYIICGFASSFLTCLYSTGNFT